MGTQLLLFGGDAITATPPDPLGDAFRRLAPEAAPSIVYAAARRRIFSWTPAAGGSPLVVRVGPEFRLAPPAVAEALVRIVTRRRLPREVRRRLFFEVRSFSALKSGCGAGVGRCLPPQGQYVDLAPLLAKVQEERFRTPIPAAIGWTERPLRRLMGRFEKGSPEGLVVVNRLLDSPLAPNWYLDFLVYHELLHAVIPPRPGADRILIHPPEFRRAERRHPEHARARLFERWASGRGFRLLLDPLRPRARLPSGFR
jgi:hypothetical protein